MELRNCPFCGSDKVDVITEDEYGYYWWVGYCDDCQCFGPKAKMKPEAVEKWNDRIMQYMGDRELMREVLRC